MAAQAPTRRWDDDSHPWLAGLDEAALAEIAVDLTESICRPAFGSLSKRELEQTTFRLLYQRRREDWRTLGDIADDLAISRAKARSLFLEYRAREVGGMNRGERLLLLREEVLSWPSRHVDQQAEQLRIVVDDPFIRDILKNFAYSRGILVDQAFSGEILVFTWDAYAQLLGGLYESGRDMSRDDVSTLGAYMRRQILAAAGTARLQQALLDRELEKLDKAIEKIVKTKGERRDELMLELGKTYGPTVVKILIGAVAGA
jgi:hypothetical protein